MKKLKTKILILLTLVVLALSFAGCSIGGMSLDDIKNEHNVHVCVNYYANGGMFDAKANIKHKSIYFKEDTQIMNITSNVKDSTYIVREDYIFMGWYEALVDEDGKPVYTDEANTELALTDRLVDFTKTYEKGTEIYIGAKWVRDSVVNYHLVSDGAIIVQIPADPEVEGSVATTATYNTGDVIASTSFGQFTELAFTDSDVVSLTHNGTYIATYLDAECTQPYSGNIINKPTTAGDNVDLYVKYVPEKVTVVKDSNTVKTMFTNLGSNKKYYVREDIVYTGDAINVATVTACQIQGNGFTISNLSFKKTGIKAGETYAIFGRVRPTAKIENLTIENVSVKHTITTGSANVYALFTKVEQGAEFVNFAVNNLEMSVDGAGEAINLSSSNSWKYGQNEDIPYLTDAQFEALYSGITVTNATYDVE